MSELSLLAFAGERNFKMMQHTLESHKKALNELCRSCGSLAQTNKKKVQRKRKMDHINRLRVNMHVTF